MSNTTICGSATFTTRLHDPSVVIVVVNGELDFTNAKELIEAATQAADDRAQVVIDLSGVEFFGTAGFAALHALGERYTQRRISWAVVPSRNVNRVVQICDTGDLVPLQATLAAAIESM